MLLVPITRSQANVCLIRIYDERTTYKPHLTSSSVGLIIRLGLILGFRVRLYDFFYSLLYIASESEIVSYPTRSRKVGRPRQPSKDFSLQ